jgi:hypothetical protein
MYRDIYIAICNLCQELDLACLQAVESVERAAPIKFPGNASVSELRVIGRGLSAMVFASTTRRETSIGRITSIGAILRVQWSQTTDGKVSI